jgi:putative methyltransferase
MKQNLYLFQPQYSIDYGGRPNYWIPYSAGCIWAYAQQFKDITNAIDLKEIIFRREPPLQVLERLDNPAICGFSCYVWNEQWNLAMAKVVKEKYPNCIIMFGGPQANGGYLKHNFINSIMIGEGELQFTEALRGFIEGKNPEIFYKKQRVEDLDIPSPYLLGLFDKMIADNPNAEWNVTFETNRGCPYSCTFCDWGGVTYSKIKKFSIERIRDELEWVARNPVGYMFCADANFGIFKDRDLEIARMIKDVASRSRLDAVNIQFAKNSNEVVYQIGKELNHLSRGITMSVQSLNPDTMKAIKRTNMATNNVSDIMKLSDDTGVSTYSEFILGLPLETLESWKQGFAKIVDMGQHNSIDVWFGQVLANAELNSPESRQKYGIKTIVAKDYYPQYSKDDWREPPEEIEIINETNTMTRDEMVDAYMYGWMYIHFHTTGYTQLLSRYCNDIKSVSYHKFYSLLWDMIPQEVWLVEHYNELKTIVHYYLTYGNIPDQDSGKKGGLGHGMHSVSFTFLYQNRDQVYNLGRRIIEKLVGNCPKELLDLQKAFIFDPDHQYPIEISIPFNPVKWNEDNITVLVDTRIDKEEITGTKNGKITHGATIKTEIKKKNGEKIAAFDMYTLRRRGLLKSAISIKI